MNANVFLHFFQYYSKTDRFVFGQREEARVPGRNLCRHKENMFHTELLWLGIEPRAVAATELNNGWIVEEFLS